MCAQGTRVGSRGMELPEGSQEWFLPFFSCHPEMSVDSGHLSVGTLGAFLSSTAEGLSGSQYSRGVDY